MVSNWSKEVRKKLTTDSVNLQKGRGKKKDLKTREHKGNDNVVKFEHSSEPLGNRGIVRNGLLN